MVKMSILFHHVLVVRYSHFE